MKALLTACIILGFFGAGRCTGDLPLSDLMNNTITLKVLGTYESNDPYASFTNGSLYQDDVIAAFTNASPGLNGTPLQTYAQALGALTGNNLSKRIKYYIDIAEIRIAEGQGKSSSQAISDYWSQFAINRQLMCSDYTSADNRTLANCSDSNGAQRLTDFFNGGFTYPAVDIASGNYNHLGVYFRRFTTAPAAIFNGDGTFVSGTSTDAGAESLAVTTFDNRTIYGHDVESFLQNQHGESATEPRMFPLQRKDLSLRITNNADPYVLEVRIFLNNLMMVRVRQNGSSGALVYVAPSDWNNDYKYTDTENNAKIGGSVIMTARVYQPAKVGSIQFTGTGTNNQYFAVTDSSVVLTTPVTVLPLAATRATNDTIRNLPPGSYNAYKMCDLTRCSEASTAGSCNNAGGTDGYPETASLCTMGPYTVTAGGVTQVTYANCTASCP